MSRSVNRALLIGNVGAAPEVRTTASGRRVATFSVATGRRAREPAVERTDWHHVVAWDELAREVERTIARGDRVWIEGRLEYRSWTDRTGRERHATEVVAEDLILLTGEGT
ncbi:MAG: single-stranded DNA-binding protein [Longimicrobiales bacterium]